MTQNDEVKKYESNGKYPWLRIKIDKSGNKYVIGDFSWNKKYPQLEEYIESTIKGKEDSYQRGYNSGYQAGRRFKR